MTTKTEKITYTPSPAVEALLRLHRDLLADGWERRDVTLMRLGILRAAEAESEMTHDEARAWMTAEVGPLV